MPTYTLTISTDDEIRINNALDRRVDREDGETDRQFYIRWLEGLHTELVFKDDRRQAQGDVRSDTGIVEVT